MDIVWNTFCSAASYLHILTYNRSRTDNSPFKIRPELALEMPGKEIKFSL